MNDSGHAPEDPDRCAVGHHGMRRKEPSPHDSSQLAASSCPGRNCDVCNLVAGCGVAFCFLATRVDLTFRSGPKHWNTSLAMRLFILSTVLRRKSVPGSASAGSMLLVIGFSSMGGDRSGQLMDLCKAFLEGSGRGCSIFMMATRAEGGRVEARTP